MPVATAKVQKLYEKYANDPADIANDVVGKVGPNGISRLLDDLKLDPMDRKVLILVHKMQATVQCEFTWDEWNKGLEELGVDSTSALRKQLDSLDGGIRDVGFSKLYAYTFNYAKRAGERNLDLQIALVYWEILFKEEFGLLPLWHEYMEQEYKKPVTKDTWNLILEFAKTVNKDLSNYNDEEAWPVVIDTFVGWARKRMNAKN